MGYDKFITILKKIAHIREATVFIMIVLAGVLLWILTPYFLTVSNLKTTAMGMAANGIVVLGMTVALVSGGFDLSVGSVFALSASTTALLYSSGVPIWWAVCIALMVSVACGLFNGFLIGKIGLNPLIITLGMMGIARGVVYIQTRGAPIALSDVASQFKFIGGGYIFAFPFIVIIFFILAVLGDILMRRTSSMRKVFYTGSNEQSAILSGINTARIKIFVYVLTATLAGIAGILTLSRFNSATPSAGVGVELKVISAAVIGGASLKGGVGTIFGSVLGLVLLALINNALILLNVSVYWQELISGTILILAVLIDFMSQKKKDN